MNYVIPWLENLHSILSLRAPTYIGGASNVVVQVQTTDLKGPTELCPRNPLSSFYFLIIYHFIYYYMSHFEEG